MNSEESELEGVSRNLETYPNFDKAALDQLVEDTGPQVVLRILARFYVGLEEALNQVEQGINNEDSEIIWKACHKLTGSAELIGFQEFGEYCRKLNLDMKALPDVSSHSEELHLFLSEGRKIVSQLVSSFPQRRDYL